MKHAIKCRWVGDMAFDAEVDGHRLRMDAAPEAGGQDRGPRPKPLLLAAAAGCTGMDIAALLKKMRVHVGGFEMEVEGDVTDEHPKVYSALRLLSQTRYCGVGTMLKKAVPYSYRIEFQD